MKILVLQDWLRSGGTERQSILLANAFAQTGQVVTLVTFRPGGALAGTVASGVNRHSLQPFDTHLDWFAPSLLRAVRQLGPEVILCMGRMANCQAGRLQRAFPQAAVLATMRTGKPLPGPFRRSLRQVRHVVANSRDARDELVARHHVDPARITVIHNSLVFPAAADTATRGEVRARHGASPTTVVMLDVAMFRPEKNQRELIELAAALGASAADDWQLWLAGEGPEREACERLARERGVAGRVKFLGFQADPAALYAAADLAVHASRSESLSNFLIEAQAHGLPVVAYDARGVTECFVAGVTGWAIPPGDRTAFLARLEPLLANPAQRAACAAPAREYARARFDSQQQVRAHLDLFARLLQLPPP